VELLNETAYEHTTREKAVNTNSIEELEEDLPPLCLDKAIQVETSEARHSSKGSGDLIDAEKKERRVYHLIDKKEEEHKEKESKLKIVQHRLSRKNSLNLLQLQNLTDLGVRKQDKRPSPSQFARVSHIKSHFSSQSGDIPINEAEEIKSSMISEDKSSEISEKESELSEDGLLENINSHSDLLTINVRSPLIPAVRKSVNFKNMIEDIEQTLEREEKEDKNESKKVIELDVYEK
jgi:hypothetical protein